MVPPHHEVLKYYQNTSKVHAKVLDTLVVRLQMMAFLTWDDSQRRWTQQAPGSCLEAVAARRKARPLPTGLAGGFLHGSPSEMEALLPDFQPKLETVAHHQANLQQTQVQALAIGCVPMSDTLGLLRSGCR